MNRRSATYVALSGVALALGTAAVVVRGANRADAQPRSVPVSGSCGESYPSSAKELTIEGLKDGVAGVAVADLDNDGHPDVVVVSGGDASCGKVFVCYAPTGSRCQRVWSSSDVDHNARVAIADVNNDGQLDLAVSVFPHTPPTLGAPPACEWRVTANDCGHAPRTAKLYLSSAHKGLSPEPEPISSPPGCDAAFGSPELAFGDANGDGLPDLVVATLDASRDRKTTQLLFYNHDGHLSSTPDWTSAATSSVQANAVRFGDFNHDGVLDLFFTAPTPQWGSLFLGARTGTTTSISRDAINFEQTGVPKMLFAVDFDVSGDFSEIAVAFNEHYCQTPECTKQPVGHIAKYMLTVPKVGPPSARREPDITDPGMKVGMASAVRVADLNDDGIADMVGAFWRGKNNAPEPGPLVTYCGLARGQSLFAARTVEATRFFVERLALADVDGDGIVHEHFAPGSRALATNLIVLPTRNVANIDKVQRNGGLLKPAEYSFVPGTNWISLRKILDPKETVMVEYTRSRSIDIVIGDEKHSPDHLPIIYHQRPQPLATKGEN